MSAVGDAPVWWADIEWWERKSITLFLFAVSPRQLVTMLFSAMVGLFASLFTTQFFNRVTIFGFLFFIGFAFSARRVRLISSEMQLFHLLMSRRMSKRLPVSPDLGSIGLDEEKEKMGQVMEIADFSKAYPLTFTGRVKIARQMKMLLLVDGKVRYEVYVSPQSPEYRLLYIPTKEDIGTHEVSVKLEGSDLPLRTNKITISARGLPLLESKPK